MIVMITELNTMNIYLQLKIIFLNYLTYVKKKVAEIKRTKAYFLLK